jgi:RNA polymerase sigma factor (sigma-70 family)
MVQTGIREYRAAPLLFPLQGSVASSDAELIARCHRDSEAFGVLYDRYRDRIYHFVYLRLRERAATEDVVAEIFVKALKGLPSYRCGQGPFSAWLYGIAKNCVIDHVRAARPILALELQPDLADPATSVEEQAIERAAVAQVWKAVDGLSQAQRTAVVLRLERDLPIAEIAGAMNRTEGAVKLLLHRAFGALRLSLRDGRSPI